MSFFGTKKGKSAHVLKALTGEYRIVEATEPIRIYVSPENVQNAIPLDPRNCAIAEACREHGAREAVIGASVAYVVTEQSDGEWVAMKYRIAKSTRNAIDRFDISGVMPPRNKGFKLSALPPSYKAEAQRTRSRKRTGTQKHTASVKKIELRRATDVIQFKV